MTTTVLPNELNYNTYDCSRYERDIVNSIPYHTTIHRRMASFLKRHFRARRNDVCNVIDLGTGTGLSAKVVQSVLPSARFDLVDFSAPMMEGAREKFAKSDTRFIVADYATMSWDRKYDVVMTVIGFHHQNDRGKRALFQRIYEHLNPGGVLILGDLVTYRDRHLAALNQAKHFHHLVRKAASDQALAEWAFHHLVLNQLTSAEDLVDWIEAVGFAVVERFLKINTALIIAEK